MQASEGGAKGLCYNVLAIHTAHRQHRVVLA